MQLRCDQAFDCPDDGAGRALQEIDGLFFISRLDSYKPGHFDPIGLVFDPIC
jgi:hypothetical protein